MSEYVRSPEAPIPWRLVTGWPGIYAARYLAGETYRRRISRRLNKGENLHALKRSLAYAGEGALRRRHHEQQAEQM